MIGTPEQIAERMIAYKEVGAGLILMSSLNFQEEMEYFGKRVLPLVRELKPTHPSARAPGKPGCAPRDTGFSDVA
jgi:dimethylsulfone monooxygenase